MEGSRTRATPPGYLPRQRNRSYYCHAERDVLILLSPLPARSSVFMSVTINDLLRRAVERGASDLHLKASTPPCLRINGVLEPQTDLARLTPEDTVLMALSMMSSRQ